MRHLVYSVRYPTVQINSSLFTITLHSAVRTKKQEIFSPSYDVITEFDYIYHLGVQYFNHFRSSSVPYIFHRHWYITGLV